MKLLTRRGLPDGFRKKALHKHPCRTFVHCEVVRQQNNWPRLEQESKELWKSGLWGSRWEGELARNRLGLPVSKSNTDRLEAWKFWRWLWLDTQKSKAIMNSEGRAKHFIKMRGAESNIYRGWERGRTWQKRSDFYLWDKQRPWKWRTKDELSTNSSETFFF